MARGDRGGRRRFAAGVAALGLIATRRAVDGDAPGAPASASARAVEGAAPREQRIAALLAQAERALGEMRLTTPESDSAMAYYQQVLSIDSENQAAREGVRRIVRRYVELAENAARSGSGAQAASYLERAESISPDDPEVIAARARLAAAPGPASLAAPPAPEPRWSSIRQAKQALRARRISEEEYERLVERLEALREAEILRAKADHVARAITRDEYRRRVREIERRYE